MTAIHRRLRRDVADGNGVRPAATGNDGRWIVAAVVEPQPGDVDGEKSHQPIGLKLEKKLGVPAVAAVVAAGQYSAGAGNYP